MEILYSERAKSKAKIFSKIVYHYKNGDMHFITGVKVDFFNDEEKIKSVLTADYVEYRSKKNMYFLKGNVVVNNLENNEILKARELYWDPDKKEVHTDKFIEIITSDVIMIGKGLVAHQDMEWYNITSPRGTISVDPKND